MKSSVNSIGFLSPSRHAIVEPLENRRLMSGNWSTVHSDANGAGIQAMAADKAGNVYAISIENNSDGSTVPTLIEKTAGGQWMTLLTGGANQGLNDVATDKSGNVFVAGQVAGHLAIWEQAANQSGFSMIDNLSDRSSASGIATDSAGDVFADGTRSVTTTTTSKGKTTTTTTNFQLIRKLTPGATGNLIASTVYQTTSLNFSTNPQSVAVIDKGASAGIYVVGSNFASAKGKSADYWDVLKSSDGGSNWSLVDQFNYGGASAFAYSVAGDGLGNVYVAGVGDYQYYTGFSYMSADRWLVRKSGTGNGGSWSTVDDFLPDSFMDALPYALGADAAGNMYLAGDVFAHLYAYSNAVIRTNAGGSWSTSDDYTGIDGRYAAYTGLTVDSTGNIYAGGNDDGGNLIRSMFVAQPPGTAAAAFSSASISPNAQLDSLLDSIN